jgi:DNA-nicking Smr family endonuclease
VKRRPGPDELRLWALVTSTVRPSAGRSPVKPPPVDDAAPPKAVKPAKPPSVVAKPFAPEAHRKPRRPAPIPAPEAIEPGRKRRLTRERDPIDLRLDLHGLDQDRARAALIGFLTRAQADGVRAVLVITGKGYSGDGVLRRRTPEWLSDPALRHVVAGVSEAHRRHGGEGALYVALKRRV